jgi:hypothetical protein
MIIISRRKGSTGHVIHMGERRNACKVLVLKPEGYIPPM